MIDKQDIMNTLYNINKLFDNGIKVMNIENIDNSSTLFTFEKEGNIDKYKISVKHIDEEKDVIPDIISFRAPDIKAVTCENCQTISIYHEANVEDTYVRLDGSTAHSPECRRIGCPCCGYSIYLNDRRETKC